MIKKLLRETLLINNEYPFLTGNEKNENYWFEDLFIKENIKLLKEGLIKTYPLNFIIKRLRDYGNPKLIENNLYFNLKIEHLPKLDWVNSYINSFGYFISQYKVKFIGLTKSPNNYIDYKTIDEILSILDKIEDIWLVIEPKYDTTITGENIKFLYHLTEKKYLERIKKNGLVLKSKSKKAYHPNRIYVVDNIENLKTLALQFTEGGKTLDDFIIIKIDYLKTNKPKIYNDPNYYKFGYYIIDNISPDAIVDIIKIS
ncbi:MAG: hypothetical protein ACOCP8_03460 [archaeon]